MKKFFHLWVYPHPTLKKLIMELKIAFLVIVAGVSNILATPSYSQVAKVSLDMENRSLEQVMDEIEKQSEFYFIFNQKQIDVNRVIDIQAENKLITDILPELFQGTNVNYAVFDRQILLTNGPLENSLLAIASGAELQQKRVTGTVTDMDGTPLPGVNVVVTGTTQGAMTDIDGKYSIEVPQGARSLTFSFIGMESQEITIGTSTQINVTMAESAIGLDEVVVIGYGTQKKVNLTGAVSAVKFDDAINNRPITNASQALGGNATGIWVSQNSGQPGKDQVQLRVRGWGTLNNSEPLVIIDEVEGSFDQLNPNDIESITVLKDAASASIYGSKAANGVILVKTKRGNLNEKIKIEISSYAGVQTLGRRYNIISNSADYMELYNKALTNVGSSPYFSDNLISDFKNSNDPFKYPNTDWHEYLFKASPIQESNVSIRGGSAQSSAFLSFNYLNQDGIFSNTNSERYGLTSNMDLKINKWLKIGTQVNYIKRVSNEPYNLSLTWDMFNWGFPFIAPYTKDGRFGSVQAIDSGGNLLYDNRNPLINAANGINTTEASFLRGNVYAEIKFAENLSLKTTLASTNNWSLTDSFNETIYGYTDSGIETLNSIFNREGLEIKRDHISNSNTNFLTTINYNKKFAQIHDFSAIGGIQFESRVIKNLYGRRMDPPKEGLTQVDAGTTGIVANGNMVALKMFSYFGRINYSLLDKYLLEGNLRADASSRFKKGNRWGVFPGFSAGWRLSEEEFIRNLDLISNLKLRGSWGQLGNQNISGYWPFLTTIDQNNQLSYCYGGSFSSGAGVTAFVDENITWETTSTIDFGIDVGLLKDRISIEADYFKKLTTNIIVQLPIPLILGGITSPFENVGGMVNNGFEISVNYNNYAFKREQLGFSIGTNLTYIFHNEVTKFLGGQAPDQLYLIREGYSYQTLYGYKAVGIYQTDAEAAEHMYSNGYKPEAGNLKYEDVNEDGILGYQDKQELGNTIPKLSFGLSSSFKYRGLDLNLLFQGLAGVHAYTNNNITRVSLNSPTITERWKNAWTPENTVTNIPSIKFNDSWDMEASSFWVSEISFVKLKNVQLGYTFPNSILSRVGVQKIYIYLNAQNVFSFVTKDYEGWDPERSTFNSGEKIYPTPRIISIGFNLTF
ncbi:MAG TPA: TonB-dependent receptor [Bacteroidales bacterium]|nr:TonB-dependent receptor [Bacteroidales bacterium]